MTSEIAERLASGNQIRSSPVCFGSAPACRLVEKADARSVWVLQSSNLVESPFGAVWRRLVIWPFVSDRGAHLLALGTGHPRSQPRRPLPQRCRRWVICQPPHSG